MKKFVFLALLNLVVVCAAFLLIDSLVSKSSLRYVLIPDSFRIPDPRLHHSLAANVSDGFGLWGTRRYPVNTNSLGLRDARARQIDLTSDKPNRVVVIGDSFTEGVGLAWEQTFVGLFAAALPNVEVLNAGVASYSPSLYLRKIEHLLDIGARFDHVIVYIDVSDIQDEAAIYDVDAAGNVVSSRFFINTAAHVGDDPASIERLRTVPSSLASEAKKLLSRHLSASNFLVETGRKLLLGDGASPSPMNLVRSMWTLREDLSGYGEAGVRGGIEKATASMSELARLLRDRGIKLTVAVYPWPDQLEFDNAQSKAVQIWRSWCVAQGCTSFIDHFPDLLAAKDKPDWQGAIYFRGDVHFNAAGNSIIAKRLVAEFTSQPPRRD